MGESKRRAQISKINGGDTNHPGTRVATGAAGSVILDPPIYANMVQPQGWLTRDVPCHALFHYFNTAIGIYKSLKEDVVYEGDQQRYNLHQLYLSVAKLYGVDPNEMGKYWAAVDLQAGALGLTQMPRGVEFGINWRDPKAGLS